MKPLYTPDRDSVARSELEAFRQRFSLAIGAELSGYQALHAASLEHKETFWRELWHFAGVIGEPGERVLVDGDRMPGASWFPDATLNFAENLLRERSDEAAIVFRGEDKVQARLTRAELHDAVSRTAQALAAAGVVRGDRVAGLLPNLPETVVAMLATTSLGAVWSSCSPDFGVDGVLDRFGQIAPKVLFAVNGYYYRGVVQDIRAKVAAIAEGLADLQRLVLVPYAADGRGPELPGVAMTLEDFLASYAPAEIEFERCPFNHPLYIVFSSGTTGTPKCIVHGAGGTLLQHLKEHQLHTDLHAGDRILYFTTCGWMMWNWLVSALASRATVMLYDGNPFFPNADVLFDYVEQERINVLGVSAKYLEVLAKEGLKPGATHDLAPLRAVLSTGSPLAAESFDYVYDNVKSDLQLASISGGTDIISCFVLGCPWLPVQRGEIQCAGLGMAVEIWNDDARPVEGEKGELVCVQPFPSMPIGFWNDPDGKRYEAAYFARFPGVWHHGDFAATTEAGGYVIFGRSDAVLNPGGVRIGTAEIYRQVDQLPEIVDAIVIGQDWQGDVRVVLFVKLADGVAFSDELAGRISRQIRANATPRHVPAKIIPVADIPRTRSGKLVELAVRDVVHGRSVTNLEAIENPEALAGFRDLPELRAP